MTNVNAVQSKHHTNWKHEKKCKCSENEQDSIFKSDSKSSKTQSTDNSQKTFDFDDLQVALIEFQRSQLAEQAKTAVVQNPEMAAQFQMMDKQLMIQGATIKYNKDFGGNQQGVESLILLDSFKSDVEFALQMIAQKKTVLAYQAQAAGQTNPEVVAQCQLLAKKLETEEQTLKEQLSITSQDKEKLTNYYTKNAGKQTDDMIPKLMRDRAVLKYQKHAANPQLASQYDAKIKELDDEINNRIAGNPPAQKPQQNPMMMLMMMLLMAMMPKGAKAA